MGTAQNVPLRALTVEERAALERMSRASSERMDRTRRARALLGVAGGLPFVQAAHYAGLGSGSGVAGLVQRFSERGMAALSIAAGRGRKPTYDPMARSRIVALAQQEPERRKDGTASWSLSLLQKRLRKEGLARTGSGWRQHHRCLLRRTLTSKQRDSVSDLWSRLSGSPITMCRVVPAVGQRSSPTSPRYQRHPIRFHRQGLLPEASERRC